MFTGKCLLENLKKGSVRKISLFNKVGKANNEKSSLVLLYLRLQYECERKKICEGRCLSFN